MTLNIRLESVFSTATTRLASIVAGAALLCAASAPAMAGSVTEAGETVGLALAAPLPPGWYLVDTGSYISRENKPDIEALVNIPVIAWSSPWMLFGGRVEAYAAFPEDVLNVGGTYTSGFYNDALLVGEAWDFGNGWSFSAFVGGYGPMNSPNTLSTNSWVFNFRPSVAYIANDWTFAVNMIYGVLGHNQTSGAADASDYLNYDLTAVKTIGNWTIGPIGYGSTDTNTPYAGYTQQSQFALGGFVGYGFGPVTWQFYMTHDITQTGYTGDDTRAFMRWIVPLKF